MSNNSINSREDDLQITDTSSFPYEIVHTDHFGPLKEATDGSKHILILVDAFTRYTSLFPVKLTSSKETIKNLSNTFADKGNPSILVSDRATAFTSSDFYNFLESRKIKHRLVAVVAPANGLVERINRFLKSSLKKISEDQQSWSSHIGIIQYVFNNVSLVIKSISLKIALRI